MITLANTAITSYINVAQTSSSSNSRYIHLLFLVDSQQSGYERVCGKWE